MGPMAPATRTVSLDRIQSAILWIRREHVMLDADLAVLYAVSVKALNQAVRRNRKRFPPQFMFQLTRAEAASLRSRFVTLDRGRGRHRKYLPYAFTEQGVGMLSSVLRSERAIRVNIAIMEEFVRQRRILASYPELKERLDVLERKYDAKFKIVFDAIRALMEPEPRTPRRIGFLPKEPAAKLRARRLRS